MANLRYKQRGNALEYRRVPALEGERGGHGGFYRGYLRAGSRRVPGRMPFRR